MVQMTVCELTGNPPARSGHEHGSCFDAMRASERSPAQQLNNIDVANNVAAFAWRYACNYSPEERSHALSQA